MKNFFQRILGKLNGKDRTQQVDNLQEGKQQQNVLDPTMLPPLLSGIQNTQEVEYDCEDVYQLMDQYVEMVRRGEDTARLMPLMEHHLKMCGDCREEVEALLRMMDSGAPEQN